MDPVELFRGIDVYLFDQLLKGRIQPGMRILDVGCGGGRNLRYFMHEGYRVSGLDSRPEAIAGVRELEASIASQATRKVDLAEPPRFRVEAAESSSFEAESQDVVICNAVLHFARDEEHFQAMLAGAWRALKVGGIFFARLASSIGIESLVRPLGQRRFDLPDGSQRFLVDEAMLLQAAESMGAELLDPIKTTNVQNLRCMTTWVLRRTSP
ncbi:MAG: tellurite methyltransferase [Planctomycetota bacterium]|jgi:tellurite methyltransferase